MAALASALLVGCSKDSEALPLIDDFAGECTWPESSSDIYRAGCVEGRYVLRLERSGSIEQARSLGDAIDALRIEVSIASGRETPAQGVGCWSGEDVAEEGRPGGPGFAGAVAGTGEYAIFRDPPGPGTPQPMLARRQDAVELREGTNRIGVDCVRGAAGVTIALRLNGNVIAVAKDDGAHAPFTSIGMFATNAQSGGEARFDDVSARALSREEASAATGRAETPEEFVINLPFEDDFETVCEWPRAADRESSGECVDGQFDVVLEQPTTRLMQMGLSEDVDAVRFEVDVTPEGVDPDVAQSYGVGCWMAGQADPAEPPDSAGYTFVTAPDAGWAIHRVPAGRRPVKLLLLGAPGTLTQASNTNTIGADCVFQGGRTTLVVLFNGEPVGVLRERGGAPFGWIGLAANTAESMEVLFDNARARALSAEEAAAVAAMAVTPTPTGEPITDAHLRQLGAVDDPYD